MASGSESFNQMASAIKEIKRRKYSKGGTEIVEELNEETDYTSRRVKSTPPCETHIPTDDEFFIYESTSGGAAIPNAPFLKQHFIKEGRVTESQALYILEEATRVLTIEPNLLEIQGSTTVCGDIHGQYYDLMKLFEVGGNLTDNKYLFLGDYVDRGSFGIECLMYLYSLKLQFPKSIYLLRGNHECRHLTEFFTFKRECLHKYSIKVYEAAIKSFQALPVAAVLDHRFFCVHGGLSPELGSLGDIKRLDRFREPGSHGLLCDLLWSDPAHDFDKGTLGSNAPGGGFVHNETRGCSFFFSYEATCQFLERNRLLSVIRGHEAQDAGYQMYKRTPRSFPAVITMFSAPNYLDCHHNRAAVLKYVNKNIVLRQFNCSPHPYWLPNFMDAFTWSLPFVGSKIAEMFLAILSICTEEELLDSEESDLDEEERLANLALTDEEISQRKEKIRNKVLAVGRMARAFKMLREEAENVSEFKTRSGGFNEGDGPMAAGMSGGMFGAPTQVQKNALGVSGKKLAQQVKSFDDARRYDVDNERLPSYEPASTPFESTLPAPSMRQNSFSQTGIPAGSTSGSGRFVGGFLSRGFDEDAEDDADGVSALADRVARIRRGQKAGGKPPYDQLKRYETF